MSETPPFPETDADAQQLFEDAQLDPYPDIPCGLLNSSDILAYVSRTGMIHPFSRIGLKTASCSVSVGSKAIYWDDRKRLNEINLRPNETADLPPNSIVYIWTKEKFRLPPYMAIRFNLKISNVHRGLLLGTGPIVDPGFEGHLLIPLHNLTSNTYYFREGESFVWVEFTKVTPNALWRDEKFSQVSPFDYVAFPDSKKRMSAWDYLTQAHGGAIQSSISEALATTQTSARKAEERVNWLSGIGFVSAVVVVIGLITVALQAYALLQATMSQLHGVHARIEILESKIEEPTAE